MTSVDTLNALESKRMLADMFGRMAEAEALLLELEKDWNTGSGDEGHSPEFYKRVEEFNKGWRTNGPKMKYLMPIWSNAIGISASWGGSGATSVSR